MPSSGSADVSVVIEPVSERVMPRLLEHFERHRQESGRDGDSHFMPFEPDGEAGPVGLDPERWQWPLDRPGWQRWFLAIDQDRVVGHVDLKGDGLATGQHRCTLGIGIERPWRGRGLGRRLMVTAMDFARQAPSLEWLDLNVMGGNLRARRLYEVLGFEVIGTIRDRFRLQGEPVDDVLMTLSVGANLP